jgi:hypothetical protein
MYENLYRIGGKLQPLPMSDVTEVEKQLGLKFPTGYSEYITELGEGYYCGHARVHLPAQILQEYKSRQEFWSGEYWWESNQWTREIAGQCIPIADSLDGDQLLFYPLGNEFYYLDRGSIEVFKAGSVLQDALNVFVSVSAHHSYNIPFFTPESYRNEVLFYLTYSEEIDCQMIAAELQALGIHSQVDAHDFDVCLYVPDITVSAHCERGLNGEILERIITCLEELGLTDEY